VSFHHFHQLANQLPVWEIEPILRVEGLVCLTADRRTGVSASGKEVNLHSFTAGGRLQAIRLTNAQPKHVISRRVGLDPRQNVHQGLSFGPPLPVWSVPAIVHDGLNP